MSRDGEWRVEEHYILAVCLDFGDTLVDQGTEVKDETPTTLRGELIPGAGEMVRELKRRGYRLAIVSNGPVGSVHNVLSHHGLYDFFKVFAISGALGVEKPDPKIFQEALIRLNAKPSETMIVGDSLERDIKGGRQLDMVTVLMQRYQFRKRREIKIKPDYRIQRFDELLEILARIQ